MVPAVGWKQERENRTPGGERGCTLKEGDQGKSYLGRDLKEVMDWAGSFLKSSRAESTVEKLGVGASLERWGKWQETAEEKW